MEKSEKTLLVSESLLINIDISNGEDISALSVIRYPGSKYEMVNVFYGGEAEWMYERLVTKRHPNIINSIMPQDATRLHPNITCDGDKRMLYDDVLSKNNIPHDFLTKQFNIPEDSVNTLKEEENIL